MEKSQEKSKVYFTDMRTTLDENLLQKLERLVKTAGMETINFKNKFAAIKIHFGEPGNLAYLRPNYSKVIVDLIRKNGGKPFLTDCNTLYVGGRKNALDHLDSAYTNGYSPFSTGCHVIIADGLKGTDEVLVPINGEYVKEAKIGQAIMDADVFITLNHFKGHEQTGFGGALKNIGMGCGSRAGKMEMHSSGKPYVVKKRCISCGSCAKNCAHGAISFVKKKAEINQEKCVGCGRCIGACPEDAVTPSNDESTIILNKKIAEYSLAVLKGRPHFHISLVVDVSPNCDCHSENDAALIPNIGMFASFDPVALDQCCADMCQKQPILDNCLLTDEHNPYAHIGVPCRPEDERDYFDMVHPNTDWRSCIEHAIKFELGTDQYELIEI